MKHIFETDSINAILTNRGLTLQNGSKKPFNNLNIAYHVNDIKECVDKNRLYFLQKYFLESTKNKILLYLTQVHSNHIFCIKDKIIRFYTNEGLKEQTNIQSYEYENIQNSNIKQINLGRADGIICDNPNFIGLIMVADCNAILLYDSKQKVFALLHAGRAGIKGHILSNAIKILKNEFNTKLRNLKVYISPSIRQCCYEISNDLVCEFNARYIYENRLDMIKMLCDEMSENKIIESNIEISPICTCCNEEYFSHRRCVKNNDNTTGRFGIFATIM